MDRFVQRMRSRAGASRQKATTNARQLNARSRGLARRSAAANAIGNRVERSMHALQRMFGIEFDEFTRIRAKIGALEREVRMKTAQIRELQGRGQRVQGVLRRMRADITRLGGKARQLEQTEAGALAGYQVAKSMAASRGANAMYAGSQLR